MTAHTDQGSDHAGAHKNTPPPCYFNVKSLNTKTIEYDETSIPRQAYEMRVPAE